ncbi:MAG: radical SAM protein, partial [bacterium]|nr:radical SAM protein [bacterium]
HFTPDESSVYLETGKEFFDLCRLSDETTAITDFFVLDENFFNQEERSRELLALMEEHGKPYSFSTFSSADNILRVGPDFIQRIGIDFLWIGVESLKQVYKKNLDIDFHKMILDLKERGISVLTSGILFLEHHTKESIHEDIDFMVSLKPDFIQFSQLCPVPQTVLYKAYLRRNKMLEDVPYEEWHGQHKIFFKHPHFTPDESSVYLENAFKKDFDENGPSILRMADTYLRGAIFSDDSEDEFMKLRHRQRRKNALDFYSTLNVLTTHAPNDKAREQAEDVLRRYRDYFGKQSLKGRMSSAVMQTMMIKEKIRNKLIANNMRQPKTLYTNYRLNN